MGKDSRRLTALSRELRQKETDAERNLWGRLRNKQIEGVKFRRQQRLGPYVVDFVSLGKKLVIEIDGGQHAQEDAQRADQQRTAWLEDRGYRVMRFWDNEVLTTIDGVLERIREALL